MRIVALGKYSIMNNYTNPDLLVAFFEPMLNSMIESRIEAILSKKLQEIELFAKEDINFKTHKMPSQHNSEFEMSEGEEKQVKVVKINK